MSFINKENSLILIISLLIIISFFVGFSLNENSAGAGGYKGDFGEFIWPNLQLFRENIFTNMFSENYTDSRTPVAYILHALINPFTSNQESFRLTVFIISLFCPFFLFLNLKLKFYTEKKYFLFLLSLLLLLSPYFRTSAFWGLNENYGLLTLLISFYFYQKIILKTKSREIKYYEIFLIAFSSSLCFYFDQKLLIFPLILFFLIITNININIKLKITTFLLYFVFGLPALYMFYKWQGILPMNALAARKTNAQLNLLNLGYASSIIFFYIIPFLMIEKKLLTNLMSFLKKNFFLYFTPFLIYLVIILFFSNFYEDNSSIGRGVFFKLANVLFVNSNIKFLFTALIFFISWLAINYFLRENFFDKLFYFYFLFISLFIYPIFQEYFDPLILILIFTFWQKKILINKKNILFLTTYFSFFLIFSNAYYLYLLN